MTSPIPSAPAGAAPLPALPKSNRTYLSGERKADGMSYPTWCRRFREWRPRRDVTMRQNRSPGERLFVDYAGMTVPLLVDGKEYDAQVFVASMGVSGRLYVEATLSQKIEDWCASHVRCFQDMGWAPQLVVIMATRDELVEALSRRYGMRGREEKTRTLLRNQDYALNWRLRERGEIVWFDPALRVAYRPRETFRGLARQYFAYGWWKSIMLRRHPGPGKRGFVRLPYGVHRDPQRARIDA